MADPTMNLLVAAILEGDGEAAISQADRLRESGVSSKDIVVHGVEAAMATLDAKCTLEQFNLLEIMLAGRAVMEVMKVLQPSGEETIDTKVTVVIATLEGDVHDLGKNILKMVRSCGAGSGKGERRPGRKEFRKRCGGGGCTGPGGCSRGTPEGRNGVRGGWGIIAGGVGSGR